MSSLADVSSTSPIADVWFFNVGQGDCTLVVDRGTHQAVLIDCPSWNVDVLHDALTEAGAEVFAAIVTHWDLDHYGGLSRISRAISTSHVYYNHDTLFADGKPQSGKYIRTTLQAFLDLTRFGTQLHSLRYEDELSIGSVKVRVLAPTQAEVTRAYLAGKRNVASAVVRVESGSLRALIGGDAVASTWKRLLDSSEDLSANILRWPHHGADLDGGSLELVDRVLTAVDPEQIIVSTGFGNRYLHPSVDVISLAAERAQVLCTQVTAKCFGYMTKSAQESSVARRSLGVVTAPACANTVKVTVTASGMAIEPSQADHMARIRNWPAPLCRPDQ